MEKQHAVSVAKILMIAAVVMFTLPSKADEEKDEAGNVSCCDDDKFLGRISGAKFISAGK